MGTAAVAGCLEMQWLQMLCLLSPLHAYIYTYIIKRSLEHSEHRRNTVIIWMMQFLCFPPQAYFSSTKQGKIGRSYAHYPLAGLASAENYVHTKLYTCMKAYTHTSTLGMLTSQVPCLTCVLLGFGFYTCSLYRLPARASKCRRLDERGRVLSCRHGSAPY